MNALAIKFMVFVTFLFSQSLLAARILDGVYDSAEKKVQIKIAYVGGCDEPNYYINWTECGWDSKSQRTFLYGMLLSDKDVKSCDLNVEQEIEFDISQIKCEPDIILLKSTSSKVPFLIQK